MDARHLNHVLDGLGRYMLELINNLDINDNYQYTILHAKDFPFDYIHNQDHFQFKQINIRGGALLQHLILPFHIFKLKADTYFYPFIDPPIFSPAKKNIFAVHDLNHFFFSKYAATERKFAIIMAKIFIHVSSKQYNHVVVFSQYVKDQLNKHVAASIGKTTVIYHGFSPDSFDSGINKKLSVTSPFILYIGNNRPHKNIKRLIDSFKLISLVDKGIHLVIAGNQLKRFIKTKDYVEVNGLSDKITILNKVSNSQLKWLYKHCELVTYPSVSEGFGLPLLEAWHFETPIIASSTTCIPEIGANAVAYYNPFDVEDMSIKTLDLLNDKEISRLLIERGTERLKHFNWNNSASEHQKIFTST